MIQRIKEIITAQNNGTIDAENIYVIDYKNINGGDVKVLDSKPKDNCVHLTNEKKVNVYYVAFKENALKVDSPKGQDEQCECVLFPTSQNVEDWILFIETKYANDFNSAFNLERNYPNKSISQIISTVEYFRKNDILPKKKRVFAMVSFPKLVKPFSEVFTAMSELTIEEILMEHNILLRPTNSGTIKSPSRIKL